MIGSSHSIVSNKIGLKLSVSDVENLVISGINAKKNRQANPILMV